MSISYKSFVQNELNQALINAINDGINGIILSNNDPRSDYKALLENNHKILNKYGLSIKEEINKLEDGSIKITLTLLHSPSAQYINSQIILPKEKYRNPLTENSSEVFLMSRILCEMLLGISSHNDAIEFDLFGPKRKHREIIPFYDKTADHIEFEFFDHQNNKYIQKKDRRSFDRLFIGMTSEKELETKFEIPEYRRFSWSDIKLFLRCKRCFYNAKKMGVKLNGFDNKRFGLEKVIDKLLKDEFDSYRENNIKHPIMDGSNAIKLLKHKKLNKWRNAVSQDDPYSIGGIQFQNVWENWIVYGGVDDVWLTDQMELIIVDYKSSTNGKIYPEYQKQLEFYAWIFKQNNYKVSSVAYMLLYVPITNKNTFDWKLDFKPDLIELSIDDSWIEGEIDNALKCLSNNVFPEAGVHSYIKNKKCELCDYVDTYLAKKLV